MQRLIHFAGRVMLACGMALCVSATARGETVERLDSVNYFVQSWQTDEGLPGNTVNEVLQDQQGFIWLATIGGLVRFDGVSFKPFTSPLIARIASRNLRALAKTRDSALLMLPAVGGVVQLKDGQFSSHPIGEGLAGRQMQTLFVDPGGAIWVGMYGGGVRRWKNGTATDFGPANGLSSRARSSFATDKEGRTWVASGDFLGCYSGETLTHFNENLDATENTVATSSGSGGIWICKNTQLLKMDGGQFSIVSTHPPWVAVDGVVRALYEDSNRVLWIGTSAHGLFAFAGGEFARAETSQSQITAITEDAEGSIRAVPDSALAPEVRHHPFLVVKEAMNNVIKQAQATEATLNLQIVENILEIRIVDNGRGFSPAAIAQSKRHGFPNMRARVEQLGISFDTVRFHLKDIYAKLHVRSKTEAVVKYLK